MIRGLGTDIIEILRIGRMIERHGEVFLQRVYTEQEIAYCQRRRASYQHFAGRWAAKEAAMKVVGTGWSRGVSWRDIEVHAMNTGEPRMEVRGAVRDLAEQRGIENMLVTISHCRAYATATVIGVGR